MNNQQSSNRFFFNVDWVTILIYVALCTIGFVNIYASIYNAEESAAFNFGTNYGKQLIFILTGLILGFSILLLDAKFFSIFSPIIYGVTMLLLLVVLVVGRMWGVTRPGSLSDLFVYNLLSWPSLVQRCCWPGTSAPLIQNSIPLNRC